MTVEDIVELAEEGSPGRDDGRRQPRWELCAAIGRDRQDGGAEEAAHVCEQGSAYGWWAVGVAETFRWEEWVVRGIGEDGYALLDGRVGEDVGVDQPQGVFEALSQLGSPRGIHDLDEGMNRRGALRCAVQSLADVLGGAEDLEPGRDLEFEDREIEGAEIFGESVTLNEPCADAKEPVREPENVGIGALDLACGVSSPTVR